MKLPTPLERATFAGRSVWLKREDLHELGAFKWRGAQPALERSREAGADAVVTASTGNHGAATAWAAQRLGMRAVVYVPEGANPVKLAFLRELDADLRETGSDLDEAKDEARAFATAEDLPFFEDGVEPAQFEGYAEIGRELLAQLGDSPRAVVVPVGNGALLVGIARAIRPPSLRIGVVAAAAPVMKLSWDAGRPVETDRCATAADGLAVRVAIPRAVEELNTAADRMLEVTEEEIASAIIADYEAAGVHVEAAAAAALAALPQVEADEPVLLVTGRNR